MNETKPFDIPNNFTKIPNQLFDTRSTFLTSQQKVFLIFLYRRLWGMGKIEINLSYSVIFEDIPCIIKNKQKFSNMINDLADKGLIKIVRGHKRCHTYIINEENYKNLIYWGERSKNKNYSEIQKDIENGIKENKIEDNHFSNFDINENTIETLQYVYEYEYNKIYPKKKYRFTKDDMEYFYFLKNELDEIPGIHYATFIRCFFLDYFDDYYKPQVNEVYRRGLNNYQTYRDIVIQTPIDDDTMKYLFINIHNGNLLLKNKTMEEYIEKNKHQCAYDNVSPHHLFYCSKKYNDFCINWNEKSVDERNEIIENIKKYPVIVYYVNSILKDDSIFMEVNNE